MKHDDKNPPETAKSAIEAYYEDLLCSMLDSSLRTREQKELEQSSRQPPQGAPVVTESAKPNLISSRPQSREVPAKTTLFQANRLSDVLAPVVIPAAFPKFAPIPASSKLAEKPLIVSPQSMADPEPKPAAPAVAAASQGQVSSAEIPARVTKTVVPEIVPKVVPETAKSVPRADPVSLKSELPKPQAWLENGRPVWGQRRFECLLFKVAGLKLAVPMVSLGSIYKIEKDLTPLVGRADWFMGLYRSGERNIQVIDTAQWVMPDRWSESCRKNYHFIIRLGGNNWGMACDAVEQSVQLEPAQVKWRTERSKRPWLSGTVIDYMCALLDAETMGYLLQRQARLRGLPFST